MISGPDWPGVWGAVRERLRRELGEAVFEAWIGPLTLESCDKSELCIGAAKPFVRTWVANHYLTRLDRAFRVAGAVPASISIVIAKPQATIGGNVVRQQTAPT